MKQSGLCSTSKIELKNKLRSVSISQMRDIKINKFLRSDLPNKGSQLIKYNESTPKSSRRLSKEMLSPGYRKKVKTIIHKSSPMNFDLNIVGQVKSECSERKHFGLSKGFSVTVRKNYLKSEKSAENMKATVSRSKFIDKFSLIPPDLHSSNMLEKIKEKFQSFKNTHYSILNEFNV